VGLDRAFYATPSAAEYAALAELVPQAFRFTVKAEQRVTRPDMAPDGGTFGDTVALRHSGVPNPRFLDHAYFRDAVLAPAVEGLGGLLGPVVLQFPHLDLSAGAGLGGAEAFVDRLAAFLARACGSPVRGAAPAIAVEVRNRELLRGALAARYASALRAAGCVHSFLQHPTMPGIAEQRAALEAAGGVPAGPVVVRWMLRHHLRRGRRGLRAVRPTARPGRGRPPRGRRDARRVLRGSPGVRRDQQQGRGQRGPLRRGAGGRGRAGAAGIGLRR
jgi:uncharacterized protein YecE (DUF72 family)